MVFSSTSFLFFFLPIVLVVYTLTPRRAKNSVLLVFSLVFYFWGEGFFVLVMLASIAANYGFGLWIGAGPGPARERPRAKLFLGLAVLLNLGLLMVYKYSGFLLENLDLFWMGFGFESRGWSGVDRLPIGISFFTFQALSYVIDVYRGDARVQRNPFDLCLYIALFPQLIAGPIVRYQQIESQLTKRSVDWERMALGIRRFVVGLGKKVLIATPLSALVDQIYELGANELSLSLAWLGAGAFILELYFDFSGYSDMAIGLGHMLGFRFPENFDYPYVARSIREMWRRWHMSLTTWFRDYLYVPLGGNRRGTLRTYFNLMTIFVLCGLWHGAQWTFVLFGVFFGAFLIFERLPALAFLRRTPRPLQHLYALVVWVLGMVPFRATSVEQTTHFWGAMCALSRPSELRQVTEFLTLEARLTLVLAVCFALPILPTLRRWKIPGRSGLWAAASAVAVTGVLVLSVIYLAASTHDPFIYFRF